MSFEEFTRYREEFYSWYEGSLYSVFNELLQRPTAEEVDVNNTDSTILVSLYCPPNLIAGKTASKLEVLRTRLFSCFTYNLPDNGTNLAHRVRTQACQTVIGNGLLNFMVLI